MKPLSPRVLARLEEALAYVRGAERGGSTAADTIRGLCDHHGATYEHGASNNQLRCAGAVGNCTWSDGEGVLASWKRIAGRRLAAGGRAAIDG